MANAKNFASDFESNIQRMRVLNILDEALKRLKLLAKFSKFIEMHPQILPKYFSKKEVQIISIGSHKYRTNFGKNVDNQIETLAIMSMAQISDSIDKNLGSGRRAYELEDIHVSQVVDLICKCKPLIRDIESFEAEIHPHVEIFIAEFEILREIVDAKLAVSGQEEKRRDLKLRDTYRLSLVLNQNIERVENELKQQHEELEQEEEERKHIVQQLEENLTNLIEHTKQKQNEIILKAEKAMMIMYNESEEKQTILQADAREVGKQYDSLMEEHFGEEKALRAKRFKTETQLASWLTKFDADMGERQEQLDELQEIYDKEKAEMDALQEQIDQQEDRYRVLMEEKEEEYRRIYEERAFEFLMNRSARRIQRCWHEYKERKAARRKARRSRKKSGEKGKKAKGSTKRTGYKKVREFETLSREAGGPDPNAMINKAFSAEIMKDLATTQDQTFTGTDVVVNLDD